MTNQAELIERIARVLFRATFRPVEDEALVWVKWDEWDESRKRCINQALAILAFLTAERELGRVEGARAGMEAAEQRCRYLLKYQNFGVDIGEYASGFEVACELSEQTIRTLDPTEIAKEIGNEIL